ncbi:hypothetical protein ACSSS7_003855 [Eimeria intestinalis]
MRNNHPPTSVWTAVAAAVVAVGCADAFKTYPTPSVMSPSSIHGLGSLKTSSYSPAVVAGSSPLASRVAPHVVKQPSASSSGVFVSQTVEQMKCSCNCCLLHAIRVLKRRLIDLFVCAYGTRSQARRSKKIILADECRNELLEGIQQVADAVRVTLGPRGRNILLEKEYGPPLIVNDGVTIARNIELPSRAHNAGAKLVQEVASTSDEWAGDGTSSTTILTAEIAKKGVEFVNKGHNPIPLQRGIQKAARIMMDEVRNLAKPVKGFGDLLNIATVATSGNAAMGEVIAKAFDKLGNHAAIVLENNPSQEDNLEFTEGYTFERGYASPYFLLGEEADFIEWKNPHVLVCDYKIESAQAMLPILEHFVRTKEPLVIIAEDFSTDMLQTCIINSMRRLLKVVTIRAPSFGERRKEYLRDIAVATNAQLISKDLGLPLEEATPSHVGSAQGIVVKKDRTSILTKPEFQDQIQERVERLQTEMDASTSKFDKEKLGERIAALSGGIARIMIGASTETEQKEKKLRYEDAINAVRAAIETGYVPGGGVTYLALSTDQFRKKVLDMVEQTAREEMKGVDESTGEEFQVVEEMESEIELQKAGASIVADSMASITKQIASNAGLVLTTEGMMIEEDQEAAKSPQDDGEL